jgi:hypothetical protein
MRRRAHRPERGLFRHERRKRDEQPRRLRDLPPVRHNHHLPPPCVLGAGPISQSKKCSQGDRHRPHGTYLAAHDARTGHEAVVDIVVAKDGRAAGPAATELDFLLRKTDCASGESDRPRGETGFLSREARGPVGETRGPSAETRGRRGEAPRPAGETRFRALQSRCSIGGARWRHVAKSMPHWGNAIPHAAHSFPCRGDTRPHAAHSVPGAANRRPSLDLRRPPRGNRRSRRRDRTTSQRNRFP